MVDVKKDSTVKLYINDKIQQFRKLALSVSHLREEVKWRTALSPKSKKLKQQRFLLQQEEPLLQQWRQEILEHWLRTDPDHFAVKEVIIPEEIYGQGGGVEMYAYNAFKNPILSAPLKQGLRPGQMLRLCRSDHKFNSDYYCIFDRYGMLQLMDWEYKDPNFDIVNYYLGCGVLMEDLTKLQAAKDKLS